MFWVTANASTSSSTLDGGEWGSQPIVSHLETAQRVFGRRRGGVLVARFVPTQSSRCASSIVGFNEPGVVGFAKHFGQFPWYCGSINLANNFFGSFIGLWVVS